MKILHVIQRLTRGGASRVMLVQIKYTRRLGAFEHVVLSLVPPEPEALALANAADVTVIHATDRAAQTALLAAADVVQVHFWNTPELQAWLASQTAPARILLLSHIGGASPAQIITRAVAAYADFILATSTASLDLAVLRALPKTRCASIIPAPDIERFGVVERPPHLNFNIGYIGTVDVVKMHPRYVELSAGARIPDAQFIVAGSSDGFHVLERQARALRVAERFVWRGYVSEPRTLLETFDLFGYPLRADNYSASDVILQEAMLTGIPPVILPYGATARLVQHQETGWIARDEDEYPAVLENLYRDSAARHRLGENARHYARTAFDPTRAARILSDVYAALRAMPKRTHYLIHAEPLSPFSGANAFVQSLDGTAPEFEQSLSDGTQAFPAEEQIAAASPVVTDGAMGGVLAYRRFYPHDPYLSLWSGLILEHAGRLALAAAEFKRAQTLGLASPRVQQYLTRVLERAGAFVS